MNECNVLVDHLLRPSRSQGDSRTQKVNLWGVGGGGESLTNIGGSLTKKVGTASLGTAALKSKGVCVWGGGGGRAASPIK